MASDQPNIRKVTKIIVIIGDFEVFNRFALMGGKLASILSGLPLMIEDQSFASEKGLPPFFPLVAMEMEDGKVDLISLGARMDHRVVCEDILRKVKQPISQS